MWYEILPTLGVFSTFLILPQFVPWVVYMTFRGKVRNSPEFVHPVIFRNRVETLYYKIWWRIKEE